MAQQAVATCTGVLLVALGVSLAVRAQAPLVARRTPPPPAPVQPLPYSHRQHLTIGLPCSHCHVNPEAGPLMTFPAADTCLGCHKAMATRPATLELLTASHTSGTPIPWVRVYRLADYVYWSHAPHIAAEITCETCHGPVAERDVMALETNITTKQGCVTCHDARQVLSGCGDCHEPRQ